METGQLKKLVDLLPINRLRVRGKQIEGCCPFHKMGQESKPSFGIACHIDYHPYNCLSCHEKGNLLTLVMKLLKLSEEKAKALILKFGAYNFTPLTFRDMLETDEDRKLKQVPVVPLSMYAAYHYGVAGEIAKRYLKSRGIVYRKNSTVPKYTIMPFGYDKRQVRVLYPWMNMSNEFVGAIGRYIGDREDPRFVAYFDLKRGKNLFIPSGKIRCHKLIVEGEIDAVTAQQALAGYSYTLIGLGNSMATIEQIKLLKRIGGPFKLGLDNDKDGRKGRDMLWHELADFGVSEVRWPEKDANECSHKQIRRAALRTSLLCSLTVT